MNSQTQQDCPLQKKYREYPPVSWPHAFSCANKCQNEYSKEGRDDKCSSNIYIAESCIPTDECNADFVKWVKISQKYIYWMEMRNITNFSLFLMRRCIGFSILCQQPTIKGYMYQKKQRKS
jgi:hypothetical protein